MLHCIDPGDLPGRLRNGRLTGRYNLEGCGLDEIPSVVYNQEPVPKVNFWEEVECLSLNVSHNQISKVPSDLSWLASLEALDLRHNALSGPMPPVPCAAVKTLHLCHNELTGLFGIDQPPLSTLLHLSCSHNRLAELDLKCASGLRRLVANYNLLKKLPDLVQQTPCIQELNLSNNQLSDLHFVEVLTELKHLELASNSIHQFPVSFCMSSQLTYLDLQRNRLCTLPEDISKLAELETLLLGKNQLTGLPPCIAALSSLKTLGLEYNSLASIPKEVSRLSLTSLCLINNNLTSLPSELGAMKSLRSMPVTGNPLRGIQASLLNGPLRNLLEALALRLEVAAPETDSGGSCLPEISNLDITRMGACGDIQLAGKKLKSVPSWVWEAGRKVTQLNLAANELQEIPSAQLASLVNLQQLKLQTNKLSAWPLPASGPAFQLCGLDVSDNPELHPKADSLEHHAASLTCLKLSGLQQLRGLDFLRGVLHLRELHLSKCGLTSFPEVVTDMDHLTRLTLDSNKIAEIPESISRLTALAELDLRNNEIARLPPQLGLLSGCLQVLLVEGNPLRTIRRTILDQGTKAVLAYLADKLPLGYS